MNTTLKSATCIAVAPDAPFDLRLTAWKLQTLLRELCGVTLPIVAEPTDACVHLATDASLAQNAYCVRAADGVLSVLAGHYTGIVAAHRRIEATLRAGGDLVPFTGHTDLPLSWQADPSVTGHTVNHDGKELPLCNRTVLTDYDYTRHYRLVWNDEFDGDAIDFEKWSGAADMNMCDVELSFDPPVVDVRDGSLVMTATCDGKLEGKPYRTNYTVATHDTMNFSGGYLEMRAKVPCKQLGEWPSFWLNSADTVLHKTQQRDALGYVNDGGYYVEVDIFEQYSIPLTDFVPNLHKHFGASRLYSPRTDYEMRQPDGSWGTFHDPQRSGIDQGGIVSGTPVYRFPDAQSANDWHTFGFLWTHDRMAFSVDGVFYYSYAIDDDPTSPFNPLIRHKETGKEYQIDMTGYRRENISLSVLLNDMFFSPGYARTPAGKWTADLYDEKGNRVVDWRELNLEDRDRLFPLVYEVDYMRLYQTEGDTLYTPDTVGKTDRIYHGQESKWDYALRGKK